MFLKELICCDVDCVHVVFVDECFDRVLFCEYGFLF